MTVDAAYPRPLQNAELPSYCVGGEEQKNARAGEVTEAGG